MLPQLLVDGVREDTGFELYTDFVLEVQQSLRRVAGDFQCKHSDGKINRMKQLAAPIDYLLYAGRWIALVREQVAGVGRTAEEARLRAKASRPKDDPQVVYVPRNYRKGDALRVIVGKRE